MYKRQRGINGNGLSYITIDGLIFSHANAIGTFFYNCSNITLKNTTVQWSFHQGLNFGGNVTFSDILIEDCIGRYNGTNGMGVGSGGGASFSNVTVLRCEAYECGRHQLNHPSNAGGAWNIGEQRFNGGIIFFAPGDAATGTNIIAEHNAVYDNGDATPATGSVTGNGIWFDSVKGTSESPNFCRHNVIYGNNACGVYMELSDYTRVYGNLIYDNSKAINDNGFASAGIKVMARGLDPNSTHAAYNLVYNNTVYGGELGIHVNVSEEHSDTPSPYVSNNIFKNNIVVGCTTAELRAVDGGDNSGTHGTGNVYDNNCFGSAPTFRWGTQEVSPYDIADYTTYDSWETVYGGTSVSIEAAPSFTDAGSDDYTLAPGSPCIGAAENLGSPYDAALLSASSWPDAVVTGSQDDY